MNAPAAARATLVLAFVPVLTVAAAACEGRPFCNDDEDCPRGQVCAGGACAPRPPSAADAGVDPVEDAGVVDVGACPPELAHASPDGRVVVCGAPARAVGASERGGVRVTPAKVAAPVERAPLSAAGVIVR